MKIIISSYLIGILFAAGLGISGMVRPERIISFLDISGTWNPSLIFVMVGALFVHFILYKLIRKRGTPLFAAEFNIPSNYKITFRLVVGSMIFGIGWGIAGYCPAPAITALASLKAAPVVFVLSMILGMLLFEVVQSLWIKEKK